MKALKILRNYFFYCGIEKDEYNALKKDAYVSNFIIWRIMHFFMAAVFLFLYLTSLFNPLLEVNRLFYLLAFVYCASVIVFFFILKKDSLVGQLLIYLSMSLLLLLGCLVSQSNAHVPATTFIAFLLITPMFMVDKPFFMAIELGAASTVFLIWMYFVKAYEVWMVDVINVTIYTIAGVFLNIIANSVRVREFILTRKINIQKDTDEMTGLRNKGALTREINAFLTDVTKDSGILLVLDVDKFKSINDTYGHDIGDSVIIQFGRFLSSIFTGDEIVGRFGGDEFIVFIKDTKDFEFADSTAASIVSGASDHIKLPDADRKVSVSVGVAIYRGREENYSDIFKKADTALYEAKADTENRYHIYK